MLSVYKLNHRKASAITVYLMSCYMPVAHADEETTLGEALESLSTQTFPQWKQQAEAGGAIAQDVVGMAYKYGTVVRQDHALSLQWFQRAAAQGYADAHFNLGRIYGKGTGSIYEKQRAAPRDDVTAAYWYRKAAEHGYAPAQLNLGQMYVEGGPSFSRDLVKAHFWTERAIASGDTQAAIQLTAIESEMSAADKERARKLSAEWNQNHSK